MATKKHAIVSADGTAEFVCPECGRTLVLRPERPVHSDRPVRMRVRCACSRTHVVSVERRLYVRKEVNLRGHWGFPGEPLRRRMTVQNLSRTGMLIHLDEPISLEEDDRLVVEFGLGAPQLTTFRKEVIVRRVLGSVVGAELAPGPNGDPYDPVYDLALAQHPTQRSTAFVP
jgi:hypothetical protein